MPCVFPNHCWDDVATRCYVMYYACRQITLGRMDGKVLSRRRKDFHARNRIKLYMKFQHVYNLQI